MTTTMRMLSVTLLLCAGMALTAAAPAVVAKCQCPKGWDELILFGNCYKFEVAKMTWADAEKKCLSQDGNLASIHSKEEHSILQALISYKAGAKTWTWVGGHDGPQEGVWLWSDGTPMTFTAWAKGQPDDYQRKQDCMNMNWRGYDGKYNWGDLQCSWKLPSICKKPVPGAKP